MSGGGVESARAGSEGAAGALASKALLSLEERGTCESPPRQVLWANTPFCGAAATFPQTRSLTPRILAPVHSVE